MNEIEEILALENSADIINELKNKTVYVKPWAELEKSTTKRNTRFTRIHLTRIYRRKTVL